MSTSLAMTEINSLTPPSAATGKTEDDDAIYQIIYNEIISTICIEVACGMHQMAKTGELKLSDIMIPRKHFQKRSSPSLEVASSPNSKKQCLASDTTHQRKGKYRELSTVSTAADVQQQTPVSGRMTRRATNNNASGGGSGGGGGGGSSVSNNCDIWGRVPPKEPSNLTKCSNCGRMVSALRFAPHLDKCMGIGNSRPFSSRSSSK